MAEPGHNNPPTDKRVEILDALGEKYRVLLAKFAEREEAVRRALAAGPIVTQAGADRMVDFVGQCMGVVDECKAAHKTEKEPWLTGSKAIDEFFLRRNEAFVLTYGRVTAQIKAWDDAQKAKQRDVAAIARGQGVAPPPPPPKIEGAYGTQAIPLTKWTFDVEDPTLIPLGYLMPDERAIQAAINQSDGKIVIPGIKVMPVDTMQIRRKSRK